MKKPTTLLLLLSAVCYGAQNYDVVVYGGTSGGIAGAITAARLGHTVALIEYHNHLGGMSASGLGKSDIETREAVGGLFREFVGKVHKYYVDKHGADSDNVNLSRVGYYYEPSVAERIFNEMIEAEPKIRVYKRYRLEEAIRDGKRLTAIRVKDRSTGATQEIRAKVFIDCTYEGGWRCPSSAW